MSFRTEKLIIDICTDGKVKVEAEGFIGNSCITETNFLEALGSLDSREIKKEFYDNEDKVRVKI